MGGLFVFLLFICSCHSENAELVYRAGISELELEGGLVEAERLFSVCGDSKTELVETAEGVDALSVVEL